MVVDSKPLLTATVRSFKRVQMNSYEFTDNTKRCITRFQEQVKIRLPDVKAKELIAVFLDPMTKSYAFRLCGGQFKEAEREITVLHREMYVALNKDQDTKQSVGDEEMKEPRKLTEAGC